MSTCNWLDFANTRLSTGYAQKSLRSLVQPKAMIRENRQLVTDEPVEFEKLPVEVTSILQGTYRLFLRNL